MARTEEIVQKLVGAGGRMSQNLGLGRIPGQILVFIYLKPDEKSLDEIGIGLGLSKASVSIAIRQLERLGMVARVWKKGDRKSYYRTADNFTNALQKGTIEFVNQKIAIVGEEIEQAHRLIEQIDPEEAKSRELKFLDKRLKRAKKLQDKVVKVLNHPILRKLSE